MKPQRDPEPPRDVRIVYTDGREVPCDVIYDGLVDEVSGVHRWLVNHPWDPTVSKIKVGFFPPHTTISFAVEADRSEP